MQEDGLQNDGGQAPAENSNEHRHGVEAKVRAAVFFLPSFLSLLSHSVLSQKTVRHSSYIPYIRDKKHMAYLLCVRARARARVRESTLHDGCCSRYAKKNHAEHVHIEQSFI